MIKTMTPMLTFNGNCREALRYYEHVFGAQITEKVTFSDVGETSDQLLLENIAFASIKIGESVFYAGDAVSRDLYVEPHQQNQVSFWLEIDTLQALNDLEKVMVETGATILVPIGEMFWGAMYVKVKDQFGINWELNMQL